MTLTFNDGASELLNITGGTATGFTDAQFFGFTGFGSSIASVALNLNDPVNGLRYFVVVDDVNYSSPVPEPASLLLLGSGLVGAYR